MAQKKSFTLIIIVSCLLCLAAAALAAVSQEDIKKFPPISGEIYGQAVRGVKSIIINGKAVPFDKEQNFRGFVSLKAGEKYLILVQNYENIRIIKKYLVMRRTAIKKFKIYVPKENIEKSLRTTRPSRQELLRRERERKLLAQRKAEEKRALEEKRWVDKTASPAFFPNEFRDAASIEALTRAINADYYGIPFQTPDKTIERLNELLRTPNFYDRVRAKGKYLPMSKQIRDLIAETQGYRNKEFSQLTEFQKKKILLLNRLLLEALYPQTPVRQFWLVAGPPKPTPTRVCEYLYVWEFSEGKLLLVKEKFGKYSAEIYVPVSKEWLELKGLSEKELRELINTPVESYKPGKK